MKRQERRHYSENKIFELNQMLAGVSGRMQDDACVYVTGSFGRKEGGHHSDLDVFILGNDQDGKRSLSRLDEIVVEAELIRVASVSGFPPFSGDGEYLVHHTIGDLIRALGTPEDDGKNTFTARMLLLLESRPLIGEPFYCAAIERVLRAYWRDYEGHEHAFMPAFLANDILRMWRTFCVNYEARTKTDPPERKAKRKLKNYKLKHSRLLTCYSGIAALLWLFGEQGTMSISDAETIVRETPLERLERIHGVCQPASGPILRLLERYDEFLSRTSDDETVLIRKFLNPSDARELMAEANAFGDAMAEVLRALGETNDSARKFYRMLVV